MLDGPHRCYDFFRRSILDGGGGQVLRPLKTSGAAPHPTQVLHPFQGVASQMRGRAPPGKGVERMVLVSETEKCSISKMSKSISDTSITKS